MEYHPR